MSNGFNFTYEDIKKLAETKGAIVTTADLTNDNLYQEAKKIAEEGNKVFTDIVDTLQKINNGLGKADAEDMARKLGYEYVDIKKLESDYINQLQADRDAEAREKAYSDAKSAYENFMAVMGFNNQPASQPVINLNAVIPQPQAKADEAEIDEAHMSFKERCEFVDELLSGGIGSSQFRKHLSVRHQNVEAKSIVKDWYKSGYISLAEKNSLLFLCNINACTSHLNVTARR